MAAQTSTIEELIPFDGWTATLTNQPHRYGDDSACSVPYVQEISVTYAALVKTRVAGPRMLVPPPPPPGSRRTAPTSRSRSPPKRMQVPPPPPPMIVPAPCRSPTKRMNVPPPPPPTRMPDPRHSPPKRMNVPPPPPPTGMPDPRQSPPKRMNVPPPPPPKGMPDPRQSPTKRMNVPPPPPPTRMQDPRKSPTKRMNVPPPPPPTRMQDPRKSPLKRMNVPPPPPPVHEIVTKLANDIEDILDRSIQASTRVYRREDFTTPDNGVWIDDIKYSRPERIVQQHHSFDLGPFPSPEYNARRQMNFSDCPSSVFDEESFVEESFDDDGNCLEPFWKKWAPPNLWKRYQKRMDLRRRRRQVAPDNDN